MGRYINLGNDGFAAVRRGLYVDKSGLVGFMNETLGTVSYTHLTLPTTPYV